MIGDCLRKVKDFHFDIELAVQGNIFLLESNRGKNFRFGTATGGDIKVSKVYNMLCLYVISLNGFVGIFIADKTSTSSNWKNKTDYVKNDDFSSHRC